MSADDRVAIPLSVDRKMQLLAGMIRIRTFELFAADLYRDGHIPGFVHLSVGQEACAVGVCAALDPTDVITSTHRGHGHVIAKGADLREMFAELMGRVTGSCRGRGGSMHIADPALGILGANGIVAGGIPMAAGAALAAQMQHHGRVVAAFFGDGAVAQGAFHEAINLAAALHLPIVFVCENNQYSEFTHTSSRSGPTLEQRAGGYGVRYRHADGRDVADVLTVATEEVARLRAGDGPVVVEIATLRGRGHYEGDQQRYRDDQEELDRFDPIVAMEATLRAEGVASDAIDAVRHDVVGAVSEARDAARADPPPAASDLVADTFGPSLGSLPPCGPVIQEKTRVSQAIRAALDDELAADPRMFVAGIDVGAGGGVFGITKGLKDRYPERVIDTPISESAILGAAVGAAAMGLHPVVELMYFDFVGVAFDQLLNQAAKLRYMTGGKVELPLTVRTQFGAGRSSGSQHSQSLEVLVAHIPGLLVVMPSDVADTYQLLRASIRTPSPVVFIENRLLYERSVNLGEPGPAPPFGTARHVRRGSDVTIVSISRLVHDCVEVADRLAADGIMCDVIDLRTVVPLDTDTVVESVRRTSRVLVVHEAVRDFGIGAEIVARVTSEAFFDLDAAPIRLGGPTSPVPYAPELEQAWLPQPDDIERAVRQLVSS